MILSVLLAVIMLGAHVILSARIWRRHSTRGALGRLLGLSFLTYCVWAVVSSPVSLYVGMDLLNPSPDARLAFDFFWYTLGLEFLNVCNVFPELNEILGGGVCFIIRGVLGPIGFFFLWGLLGALFARRGPARGV